MLAAARVTVLLITVVVACWSVYTRPSAPSRGTVAPPSASRGDVGRYPVAVARRTLVERSDPARAGAVPYTVARKQDFARPLSARAEPARDARRADVGGNTRPTRPEAGSEDTARVEDAQTDTVETDDDALNDVLEFLLWRATDSTLHDLAMAFPEMREPVEAVRKFSSER